MNKFEYVWVGLCMVRSPCGHGVPSGSPSAGLGNGHMGTVGHREQADKHN